MTKTKNSSGITFAVDDVTPATKLLPECYTHDSIRVLLGSIESCNDYHSTVVKGITYQPLLAAVYTAFSEHRPLVLSPDAVWITIAQGVAHHMAIHGERLRTRFVSHQDKLNLVFQCNDWVEGSPENPWPEAFESWTDQIREHVGPSIHDTLLCDFSLSGPIERAASQIVMMDVFDRYFHYVVYCVCGIPSVTLEGTEEDWQKLAEKVAALKEFDIDWWLDCLKPICEQFVRASRGEIDQEHWQSICKLQAAYGGEIINGWVAKLFPYLREFANGPCNDRNPIFENGEGFQTWVAPSGLSRVPFTWRNAQKGCERSMEAIGGLVGITQNPETLALRPMIGWAVRETEKIEVCLSRLNKEHKTFPGIKIEDRTHLPADLCRFFNRTNGAELFDQSDAFTCRIFPMQDLVQLDWGEVSESLSKNSWPNGHIWYHLGTLADGSWLAVNPSPQYPEPIRLRYCKDPHASEWDTFAAICLCGKETLGKPGLNSVIALSFTELLERLLDSDGNPCWKNPRFANYGDAELYTRRT